MSERDISEETRVTVDAYLADISGADLDPATQATLDAYLADLDDEEPPERDYDGEEAYADYERLVVSRAHDAMTRTGE